MTVKSFMSPEEQTLKYSRDLKNVIDTARADGYKEGIEIARMENIRIEEVKIKVAKIMKKNQEPLEKIVQYTGLSRDEIEQI